MVLNSEIKGPLSFFFAHIKYNINSSKKKVSVRDFQQNSLKYRI